MNFTFVQEVFLCMWSCDSFTSWAVCFLCGSRKSKTVIYVICIVDVGRAKGNLWQPNHKRMILCVKKMILNWGRATTIYRQVDPREVQESTWEEWWNMVGGLATLVLCKILCPHNRPVYCHICHWYRHIWWLYRTVLPLVASRRAAHIFYYFYYFKLLVFVLHWQLVFHQKYFRGMVQPSFGFP